MKCIVLAAGLSSRMEGKNKLLLPWKDTSIIEAVIATALSFTDEVCLVTGNDRDRIIHAAMGFPITEIYNPDYINGQETSIRKACSMLDDTLCFIPGDMPLITRDHYERAEANLEGLLSARPVHNGTPGHPVIIAQTLVNIIRSDNKRLVRDIIKEYSHNFYEDDEAVVSDIDTPAEYERLRKR